MKRTRLLVLVALIAWLGGCTVNPVTGESELVLMSPEREAALGAQAAEQVKQEMGLVDDPELSAYVRAIGARLAANSPRQDTNYEFRVVDMPEANAFALPGGYIYVSRGLLTLCNSEEELANVMGHEVGHVAARHSAQRETRAAGAGLLTALGTILAGAYGGAEAAQTVGQIGQVAGAGLIASYGRDQERQADSVGQRLSARSGWDPHQMSTFLRTLEADGRLAHGNRAPSFFDSHPATPERVGNTAALAGTLVRAATPPIARNRADFLRRIRGIMVGPNPAEGVVDGTSFLHVGMDFRMKFPDGWNVQNGRSAVAAISSDRGAQIALESQGRGSDPAVAAKAFLQEQQIQIADHGARRIAGLLAYHVAGTANSQGSSAGVYLTWIVHDGAVFRITGLTAVAKFKSYRPAFERAARSFRPLTSPERNSVDKHLLETATARAGETLARFSARTGNTWSAEKTSIVNAIRPDARLRAGQLLKIAVARRYRP